MPITRQTSSFRSWLPTSDFELNWVRSDFGSLSAPMSDCRLQQFASIHSKMWSRWPRLIKLCAGGVVSIAGSKIVHSAMQALKLPVATSLPSAEEAQIMRNMMSLRTAQGIEYAGEFAKGGLVSAWHQIGSNTIKGVPGARKRLKAWAALYGSITIAGAGSVVAKACNRRLRPFQAVDGVSLALRGAPTGSSFPSGHAAISDAAAAVLARFAPDDIAPAALANRIKLSRVYVGAHYPSDVEAGGRLGTRVGERIADLLT